MDKKECRAFDSPGNNMENLEWGQVIDHEPDLTESNNEEFANELRAYNVNQLEEDAALTMPHTLFVQEHNRDCLNIVHVILLWPVLTNVSVNRQKIWQRYYSARLVDKIKLLHYKK